MKHEAIWKRDGIPPAADASGFSFARSYLEVTNRTTENRRSGDRPQYSTSVYLSRSKRTSCLGNRLARLPKVPGCSLSNWRHREPSAYGGEPFVGIQYFGRRSGDVAAAIIPGETPQRSHSRYPRPHFDLDDGRRLARDWFAAQVYHSK
ncbi:hypothetical protein LZ31DRAFT_147960 [Colletotrichum somersetense]|nr:hypothetical protein LZ31DRAFT_147960 [Colletotrichum somersetense]